MSTNDFQLLMLLAKKVGIQTAKELEEFKQHTNASTNNLLLKRLALFVASGITFKEAKDYKRVFNQV